jgi:hypothetical protein
MNKYLRTAYQFGMLGAVLSGISFFSLSYFYPDPTNLNLIFGYFLIPIAVFLSIKFFKEYSNSGFLSFAEGMTVGFVTYTLIGIGSTLCIWFILLFSPDFFELIKQSKWDVLMSNQETIVSQVGQESFDLAAGNLKFMTPWDVALNDGLWKILPGLFFSIIISIILRKNPS